MKNILSKTLLLCIIPFIFSCDKSSTDKESNKTTNQSKPKVIKKKPIIAYGIKLDDYLVKKDTIKKGDTFGNILGNNEVSPSTIYQITQTIPDSILNFKRLNFGKPYVILKTKDSLQKTTHFIYEKDRINYAVISIEDSIVGSTGKKPVILKQKVASGVINSSLSEAIDDAGLNYSIATRFSEIYQWSVDFFRLQEGDQFKIIYTEKYINDSIYAGLEEIQASLLNHKSRDFYAFNFLVDSTTGRTDYFDEEASTLRKFFLKAPLNFSRISSRYTKRRFHPVQKRWKAHKGTDYAASTGTPIWSTADGVVTKSSYTRGNGRYVKIRHTNKYSTQYLHMSRRAVKAGEYVKQGQIIGYVGSTGLATGPHVCYRFWVNGRQVDPYKQDLPDAEPMAENLKPTYFEFIAPLKSQIDAVEYLN